MARMWSGLKKSAGKKRLVIDVGTSAVRVCELAKTKTGYEISKYVQREYNSDPSLEEQARNQLRSNALLEALKESKIRRRKTVLGVPGQSVFTRCRTLPPVAEFKVNQIVRYEIQQQIPFGLDQIAMDYQVLQKTEQGGYDVMMAAIKVDVVEKHLEILKAAKASVDTVDVLPIAAYNWLLHQKEMGQQGDCVALIDIGASTTDIVIERGNQFRFTRPLNIGGNDITRALAEAFNLDFISAEKIKRERAFAPTGDPQRDGKSGEVIGQVLQRLSTEIIRSFSYFRSLPGGGQVNRILLTGGCARLKNIVPYLRSQLGMDVRIAPVINNISIGEGASSVKAAPEQACVVLGMAARCWEPVAININLIPPRILETARRKDQALYWGLSVVALILIFASMVPSAAKENKRVKQRIDELRSAIRAYDPELVQRIRVGVPVPQSELRSQLDVRKRQLQTLVGQVDVLEKAKRQRRFWLDEFAFINEARPTLGQMWFSSMESCVVEEEKPQQQHGPAMRPPSDEEGSSVAPQRRGFPGLQFPGASGAASDQQGMGRGRPGGQAEEKVNDYAIPRANGVIIHGFAESDEVINEFVKGLRTTSRQMPNTWYVSASRVIFSEGSVRRVPWSILNDAPTEGGITDRGAPGGAGAQGKESLFTFTIEVALHYTADKPSPPTPTEDGTV
ncbi:MAG TPA: type IV pilus assembly protein PilM [Candidatus Hydrogenedentes bacterium]|nr:MAG: cell division protein FtsA [Candidatus Hydrogenedentes bacterium ADurb.Bin170]HNZ47775.1 type IV pilus assembly protein PilM [Candidatus Hydrogenedentota bacterium]HOD94771.1 type IV pilus assembly protein PilM [Candidatus Hydrogenedentota bacterium]HOM48262.1 type IV pilus assembly protein PilM [Candidatus Hydrogenedentota bacterium]HOR50307.1 type IV pilus assembly protein PilM [Candidatus Hydrogenedentota bacterium]